MKHRPVLRQIMPGAVALVTLLVILGACTAPPTPANVSSQGESQSGVREITAALLQEDDDRLPDSTVVKLGEVGRSDDPCVASVVFQTASIGADGVPASDAILVSAEFIQGGMDEDTRSKLREYVDQRGLLVAYGGVSPKQLLDALNLSVPGGDDPDIYSAVSIHHPTDIGWATGTVVDVSGSNRTDSNNFVYGVVSNVRSAIEGSLSKEDIPESCLSHPNWNWRW